MKSKKERCPGENAARLRKCAEDWLNSQPQKDYCLRELAEPQRLLHELQVHRIELELQNAELHQTRDELESALERYTDLYDFAPAGYFTLDRTGVINALNLTAAGLLGIDRARLPGQNIGLFVTAEDRPAFSEFLSTVFAAQGKETCEVKLLTAGTQPLFVQIEAVAAAAGQECFAVIIDSSARKQAEAEIRRLASFPLMNPNPVLELDGTGRMTFCNPACRQLLGDADSSDSSNPLIPPDIELILQSLHDRKTGQFLREADIAGRIFEERIYVLPPFQSVRIYTMDITDRKRAGEEIERLHTDLAARAAELEAANSELEAFNFTVSHDLRKPLTIINSYCQVVQELCSSRPVDEEDGYLQEIYAATLRMNRLIDTLLDFSRITHSDMHHDQVDLSRMAEETILELQLAEPERKVSYRIAAGVQARGDARLLRVVLNNLIGNAWKYSISADRSRIEFGMTEADGRPACFVRDNGPGFDMEHTEKMFLPFQRLPGNEVDGQGIGLATVKRIISRHNGRIWAESRPGKGAAFYFSLP